MLLHLLIATFCKSFNSEERINLLKNIQRSGLLENIVAAHTEKYFHSGLFLKKICEDLKNLEKAQSTYENYLNGLTDENIYKLDCIINNKDIEFVKNEIEIDSEKSFYFRREKIPFYENTKFLKNLDNLTVDEEKSQYGFIVIKKENEYSLENAALLVPINGDTEKDEKKYFIITDNFYFTDQYINHIISGGLSDIIAYE